MRSRWSWVLGPSSVVLLMSGLATPALAQTSGQAAAAYAVYLVGGINVANMTTPVPDISIPEISVSTDSRIGYIFGVLVDLPVNNAIAFETGGLISTKGLTSTATILDLGTAEVDIRMVYLDVPAHIRVGVAKTDALTGFLIAGPTLGFRLTADARASALGISETESITDGVEAFDVGLTIGGRVQYKRIIGDVRYTWGLINTAKGEDGIEPTESVKHRVLSIMGGWRF